MTPRSSRDARYCFFVSSFFSEDVESLDIESFFSLLFLVLLFLAFFVLLLALPFCSVVSFFWSGAVVAGACWASALPTTPNEKAMLTSKARACFMVSPPFPLVVLGFLPV